MGREQQGFFFNMFRHMRRRQAALGRSRSDLNRPPGKLRADFYRPV
jgi:hypothetical protein